MRILSPLLAFLTYQWHALVVFPLVEPRRGFGGFSWLPIIRYIHQEPLRIISSLPRGWLGLVYPVTRINYEVIHLAVPNPSCLLS
jgi:hypothetical protein